MRGISPIVSQILMIAIAVAAAVMLYFVVSNYMSQQQAAIEQARYDAISIAEVADRNVTTATISVYVRNLSNHTVELADAYILDNGTVVCGPDTVTSINPTTLAANDTAKVTVDFNESLCSITAGSQYTLKLVTTNGAPAEKIFTA